MNIKKFLVCKMYEKLPSDINLYIWEKIEENAALSIQHVYRYKVMVTMDFFNILMRLNTSNVSANINYVNGITKLYMKKIKYTCIQEPGTWLSYLENIKYMYTFLHRFKIHSNNIYYIMNNIIKHDEIYKNTGVEWWDNF